MLTETTSFAVSPLPKLGEIKKQTKRVVMSLPQKPKDAEDDEADEATAESLLDSNNLITGSRSRNLRGTATTADKDRKDVSSSGGKR